MVDRLPMCLGSLREPQEVVKPNRRYNLATSGAMHVLPGRGVCKVCGVTCALRNDDTVRRHRVPRRA